IFKHLNMKFAIYAQVYKPANNAIVKSLIQAIEEKGGTVCFELDYYTDLVKESIVETGYETFTNHLDLSDDTKFFVSIGGDGSMLRAANFVKSKNVPIVGINAGRLGFLANVQQDAISEL